MIPLRDGRRALRRPRLARTLAAAGAATALAFTAALQRGRRAARADGALHLYKKNGNVLGGGRKVG